MTVAEACELLLQQIRATAAARGEAASYKLLAQQSLHALAEVTRDHDRLRQRHYRLLDERRRGAAA